MQKTLKITAACLLLASVSPSCAVFKGGGDKTSSVKEKTESKDRLTEQQRMQFNNQFFEAEKEKALGNLNDALPYYLAALKIDSVNHAVMYEIAEIYKAGGNYKSALVYIENALRYEKNNIFYYASYAETLSSLSKHKEAGSAYQKMSALKPGDPEILFSAANEYIYAKDYETALSIYEQMEKKFGLGEEIVQQKKQIYLLQHKPEKAIAEVKKLVALAPYETGYLMILAELEQQYGKPQEAFRLYNEVLKIDPANGIAHYGLAEYYRSQRNMDMMLREFKLTFKDARIDAKPKLELIFQLIPSVEKDPSLLPHIFEMAEIVKDVHPDNATAYAVLGDLYSADGKQQKALEYYLQSLELDPSSYSVWRQTCLIYESANDYRNLLLQSERAKDYFPNQIDLYYFNASANFALENYKEAIVSCKTGLGLMSPEDNINARLYALMGDAYHKLKDNAQAFQAYDEALAITPDNYYVLNNYAYYLAVEKTQLEKAKSMSKRTITAEPNNATYLDTYGWVLYQMGEYQEAEKYLIQAIEKGTASAEVFEHMGDILIKLGKKAEAVNYWKKAQELAPSPQLTKKING